MKKNHIINDIINNLPSDNVVEEISIEKDWSLSARMCQNKARYKTKLKALLVANYRVGKGTDYLRVYRCPFCQGYHLTKKIDSLTNKD